ncbi:MAG: hypothetical protein QMC67_09820 [Candidatus Wallbacteria bacterium]
MFKKFIIIYNFTAIIILLNILFVIPAHSYNNEKYFIGKCWYENQSGKLLIELTENNTYYVWFIDKYGSIIKEEGLYRFSSRYNTLSFSEAFITPKKTSPVYGREFEIQKNHTENILILKDCKNKNYYEFSIEKNHISGKCPCSFCRKK